MLTTVSQNAVSPAGITADATDLEQFLAGSGPDAAAVLADLDGCLISGSTVLPGAAELVHRTGERLWIVSNNSSDTAQTLSERLCLLGLPVPAERIFLAGEQAVRDLASAMPGAQIALFAAPPLQALATSLGLQACRESPAAKTALLARDPAFTMTDLTRLMWLANRGVPLRLTNPDPFHPAADGSPVPETGALFAAIAAGVPGLSASSGGKPSPAMIHAVLQQAAVAPEDAVFIGDTDATDGEAARAAGVPFVLLRQPSMPRTGDQQ